MTEETKHTVEIVESKQTAGNDKTVGYVETEEAVKTLETLETIILIR